MLLLLRTGLVLTVLLFFYQISIAQKSFSKSAVSTKSDSALSVNYTDYKGKKQGFWREYHAQLRGEPASIWLGNYFNNQKKGKWYQFDGETNLLAIYNYKKDVLDGEVQFFENGRVVCVGHFRGLNPDYKYDTILVRDPTTHEDSLHIVLSERGSLRHGTWQYFHPRNGQLIKEEIYQVDELMAVKEFETHSVRDSIIAEQRNKNLPHINPESDKIKFPRKKKKRVSYTY